MIPTKDLCNVFSNYVRNENEFWEDLFNVCDEDDNYYFFYLSKKGNPVVIRDRTSFKRDNVPAGVVLITASNTDVSRYFKKEEKCLIPKWIKAITACPKGMLRNIETMIGHITDTENFKKLYAELHALCLEYKLTEYREFSEVDTMSPEQRACAEMAFLLFMLSIGVHPKDINFVTKKASSEAKTPPFSTFHDDSQYFPQTICDPHTGELLLSVSEDKNVQKMGLACGARILIAAPGGQGKSLFLRRLQKQALCSNAYRQVIRIELTTLLDLSESALYAADVLSTARLLHPMIAAGEQAETLLSHLTTAKNSDKPILVLLDGLNELFASSDFKKVQAILDEVEHASREWHGAAIVLTTRPSTKCRSFLNGYRACILSGTPTDKLEAFLSQNLTMDEEIKELARIPMYYNILVNIDDTAQVKTKYDILLRLYRERYNQSPKDADSFFAFFVLAPFIAREIHDNNGNSISFSRASTIAKELKDKNLVMLIQAVQRECGLPDIVCEPNVEKAYSILFHNGPIKYVEHSHATPLVPNNDEYKFFHDDIRDFLLAFSAITSLHVMQNTLRDGLFDYVKDIYFNLNLRDDPAQMVKSQLKVFCGKDIEENLSAQYAVLKDIPVSPQSILYAHTLFLISDYLSLGVGAVESTHNILIPFTERIVNLIKQDNLSLCLTHDSARCKRAILDILSKHCEHYRRSKNYMAGIELADIAEQVQAGDDAIKNQKGKLLLYMHQSHIKEGLDYPLADLGIADYTALYFEGRRLIEEAAAHDFNLSVNSIVLLTSVTAPFLFDDETIHVDFDFIGAFHYCRSLLFTQQQNNYTAKEIGYTVRQAVGLLLKGYVKFNPEFQIYEGGNPGKNSVVLGERNTLSLDGNTVKLAKELLRLADGISLATLDYYRAIVSHYENDTASVEFHLAQETDALLRTIFRRYRFGTEDDLDALYHKIATAMKESSRNVIDSCHPIYWYCDAKNLELAFDDHRVSFFEEFENDLPDTWKRIVDRLT